MKHKVISSLAVLVGGMGILAGGALQAEARSIPAPPSPIVKGVPSSYIGIPKSGRVTIRPYQPVKEYYRHAFRWSR
jgi:hypothetical protein